MVKVEKRSSMQTTKVLFLTLIIALITGCANYNSSPNNNQSEFWDWVKKENERIDAEQAERRKRQRNCVTEVVGKTAYTTCN